MEIFKKIFLFLNFFAAFVIVSFNGFEINTSNDIPTVNNESFYANNSVVSYSLSKDSVKLNEKFKFKIDYDKNNLLVNTVN